jgi:pimeloyl-ACP methyl ester carboxylesterase
MTNRSVVCLTLLVLVFTACSVPLRFTEQSPTDQPVATQTIVPTPEVPEEVIPMPVDVPRVDWRSCPEVVGIIVTLQCAHVDVPLDYAKPDGETIEIHFIRRPASAMGASKGTILVNPGGPGQSGIDWMFDTKGAYDFSRALAIDEFDLIAFDPRGTGASGGLFCQTDIEIDRYRYPDTTPDTPEEEAFLDEADAAFTTACATKYGTSLAHYSTLNTARDMDVIRRALRVEQINYIGFSYGTYLGGVYAHLFPAQVRAMVLDGAFQPEGDSVEESYSTQLGGFGKAMENWITWCEDPASACEFAAPDVGARYEALWAQYDAQPVTAADGRIANQYTIEDATKSALYSEQLWPTLGKLLANAEKGDTVEMWQVVDWMDDRDEYGHYAASDSAFPIILCASGITRVPAADPAGLLADLQQLAPYFTKDVTVDDLSEASDCQKLAPGAVISPISNRGAAPMLVIGGENDPATPMRWAEKMTTDLGPNARLVRFSGEGHTSLGDARCIDQLASDLFRDLKLPAETVRCAPDPAVAAPSWWTQLPLPAQQIVSYDPAEIAALTGVERKEGYGIGFQYSGTTADGVRLVTTLFDRAGFRQPITFDDFYGGKLARFSEGDVDVTIMVAGSDGFGEKDELQLADTVPTGRGVVFYLYFP